MIKGQIINLYKPKGVTSFGVLKSIKKIFNTNKVGHMGTLDPLAEGVLPVAINEATKLIQFINTDPKNYQVEILFGFNTDSYDLEKVSTEDYENAINESRKHSKINLELITLYLNSILGNFLQVPPVFSSVKIEGKRAYELARKNKIDESLLKARKVSLYSFEILSYDFPFLKLNISVSSGFYVRSLVRDLARFCSTNAVMVNLVRKKVGFFNEDFAIMPQGVSQNSVVNNFDFNNFLTKFVRIDLSDEQYYKIRNGIKLVVNVECDQFLYGFYENKLVTVLEKDKDDKNLFKILKNL